MVILPAPNFLIDVKNLTAVYSDYNFECTTNAILLIIHNFDVHFLIYNSVFISFQSSSYASSFVSDGLIY